MKQHGKSPPCSENPGQVISDSKTHEQDRNVKNRRMPSNYKVEDEVSGRSLGNLDIGDISAINDADIDCGRSLPSSVTNGIDAVRSNTKMNNFAESTPQRSSTTAEFRGTPSTSANGSQATVTQAHSQEPGSSDTLFKYSQNLRKNSRETSDNLSVRTKPPPIRSHMGLGPKRRLSEYVEVLPTLPKTLGGQNKPGNSGNAPENSTDKKPNSSVRDSKILSPGRRLSLDIDAVDACPPRRLSVVEIQEELQDFRKIVEDDMRRKARQESDVTMVTLLQPSEMLKSEVILHEAARKNSVERVRQLIADKVDVNSKNHLDRTALHWGAANGHRDVVILLLAAKADIEASDKYGMRPLLWAAYFGHLDTLKLLVNNGANTQCSNKQGLNMLHCAAQNNHFAILHFIQESLEGYKIDALEKNDRTALHLAAEKGNRETVQKLLDMKCDLNLKDKLGQTATHVAATCGQEDALKSFLLAGIEIDDRDLEGRSALHLAAENGHVRVVEKLLLNNADANAETTKEMTPLHLASQNGHMEVVTLLLDHNCNVNSQNHQGNTALHLAGINNYPEVVHKLVETSIEINLANSRAQTALHCAVENGHSDVVEGLLIAGADIAATERTGKTPLGLASRGSFIGIVDMIIKADRYHQLQRDESRPETNDIQFKRPRHEGATLMKEIIWKMATKQLKQNDWKKLAKHWHFTDNHIKAIEHQYTGPNSYKEHGYRLLLIWLHGVSTDQNPVKQLFEGLTAIDRRELAEQIRRKCNYQVDRSTSSNSCVIS